MEATLIGWSILILSWIAPSFIKDEKKKTFVGTVISAIASGYFLGLLVERFFNR